MKQDKQQQNTFNVSRVLHMSQVVVVNITPHLTHLGTLCFLRGIFRRVVATKPGEKTVLLAVFI